MNKRFQTSLCLALLVVLQSGWLSAMPSLAANGGTQNNSDPSQNATRTVPAASVLSTHRARHRKNNSSSLNRFGEWTQNCRRLAIQGLATLMGVMPQLNRLRELRDSGQPCTRRTSR